MVTIIPQQPAFYTRLSACTVLVHYSTLLILLGFAEIFSTMLPFSTFRAHRRRGETGVTLIVGAKNQLVSRRIIATYCTEVVRVVGVQLGGEVAHLVEAEKSTFRGELSFQRS